MRTYPIAAIILVAGCQPGGPTAPPEGESATATPEHSPPPSSDAIASSERLAGEYRVAGVDGQGIDLPYGITASISDETIHVTADCINMAWSYHFDGGALATERVPVEGCARGLTPSETAIVLAFDAADTVSLNPANGYKFAGGGHSITLFTQ